MICIYVNVCGHIVDCIEFMDGIFTDTTVSYLYTN